MISKEVLQKFIDSHIDDIAQILPGGLKDKAGKWLLVCPVMDQFDLDFSKVKKEEKAEEVVEVVEEKKEKKSKKSKKK